ncbi:IS1595 family transposase [Inconstantimicrobium mannanitabidum]|uniref:Transposase n=1 Tax=Inconstantimicrobium mannanitabidum TaxID=1604901 RepID=A0ACB5R9C8_9CLOT|nr:IS1595 family transposase [Clostridium sp. TW13]GKX65566.1 transposase [Clostridium sp. TW13]
MWINKLDLDLFSTNQYNCEASENYMNDCISYYSDFFKYSKEITSCPHCGSKNTIKYGSMKSGENKHRRYLCKACNKTFSEITTFPLSYSKKNVNMWIEYIGCMAKGMTLRAISEELKINVKTAFAWRHKILSAIENKVMAKELYHHVQIDDVIMRKNLKGNKKVPLEKKKGRLMYSVFETPENERIRVMSCIDDSENIFIRGIDTSDISCTDAKKILSPLVKPKSILCTARNFAYVSFAKQSKLKIELNKSTKHKTKTGEWLDNKIARRNGLNFNIYTAKFMGVATKYVNYYLNLYVWDIKNKETQFCVAIKQLFIHLLNSNKVLRNIDFKNVTLEGVTA